jgi:hypothetical protein
MNCYQKLKDVYFDPSNFDEDIWFCEQDKINYCAYSEEIITDPVIIISDYTLAHYKYYVAICCLKNLPNFYQHLGSQPLKIIFRNKINDDIVKHFGLDRIPDININRKYYIMNNELYLETNEVILNNSDSGFTYSNISEDEYSGGEEDLTTDEEETSDEEELEDIGM